MQVVSPVSTQREQVRGENDSVHKGTFVRCKSAYEVRNGRRQGYIEAGREAGMYRVETGSEARREEGRGKGGRRGEAR